MLPTVTESPDVMVTPVGSAVTSSIKEVPEKPNCFVPLLTDVTIFVKLKTLPAVAVFNNPAFIASYPYLSNFTVISSVPIVNTAREALLLVQSLSLLLKTALAALAKTLASPIDDIDETVIGVGTTPSPLRVADSIVLVSGSPLYVQTVATTSTILPTAIPETSLL